MIAVLDSVGLRNRLDAEMIDTALGDVGSVIELAYVLDRGLEFSFKNCKSVPFPSYESDRVNAADSEMLQRYCNMLSADIFITSRWTTPLTTPCIMLVGLKSSTKLTLRESDERRLCFKYSHAIVGLTGEDADAIEAIYHQKGEKIVPDIKEAVYRRSYPNSFYKEWSRLRRLQIKLDTKLWSEYADY